MCRIAGALGHPTLSTSRYVRYTRFLYDKMEGHYSRMMQEGVEGIFRFYEENGTTADDTGVLNVEVISDVDVDDERPHWRRPRHGGEHRHS